MPTSTPQSFLGAPSGGARPGQVAGRVVEVAPLPRVVASGPANSEPVLSIAYASGERDRGSVCTLSKPLVARLQSLLIEQSLDRDRKMRDVRLHIVAPKRRNGPWYLDTQPRLGVGVDFPKVAPYRFRMEPVSKLHFQQRRPLFAEPPAGVVGGKIPFTGNTNVFVNRLHFRLGAPVAGHPGYYHLEPLTRPVHH